MVDTPAATSVTKSRPLSLRVNFSWTFAGNIVYAACQWGMLVVLDKFFAKPAVGEFSLGLAITAPILLLSNLQLRAIQATDATRKYEFAEYLRLRLATTAIAMLATVAVAWLVMGSGYAALVCCLIGASKCVEAISDIYHGALQQHERMDRVGVSLMLKGVLTIAALWTAAWITRSLAWSVVAYVGAWAATLAFYDIPVTRRTLGLARRTAAPHVREGRRLLRLAWLSLPLGLAAMVVSLNTSVPRYIIAGYIGKADLGIFTVITSFVVVGTTIINALAQSASPRLADHYLRDLAAFRRTLRTLVGLGLLVGAAGVVAAALIGRPILNAVFDAEYAARTDVLIWIMAGAALSYGFWFYTTALTVGRYVRTQLVQRIAALAVTAAGCFLLVPQQGILGAAWAIAAGSVVQFAMALAAVRIMVRRRMDDLGDRYQ